MRSIFTQYIGEQMFLKFFKKKDAGKESNEVARSGLVHGIDPEMNYCPSCSDEYRADIQQCGMCGIALVSGSEKIKDIVEQNDTMAARSMELSGDEELVGIRKGVLNEIKYIQKLLAEKRIPSVISSDQEGCSKSCCGPEMFLLIRKDDMELAGDVLAKDFIRSTSLESHDLSYASAVYEANAAEVVCPACGCRFSPTVGACPECGLCFE